MITDTTTTAHLAELLTIVDTVTPASQVDTAADPSGEEAAQRYGRSRLSNVADVVGGKLDPAQYLRRGRHEEWTLAMSGAARSGGHDAWWEGSAL